MNSISARKNPAAGERGVQRLFLPVIVVLLMAAIGLGVVLPLVHIFSPSTGAITANELAGMLGLMSLIVLGFVLMLQNKILELQKRVTELERAAREP